MKLPLPTRESVELWQQGSTGDSRRANHRRTASVTSQEELARLIHVEFRRQLVRYLKRRVAEKKQAALKPALLTRIGNWVKAKFTRPVRPQQNQLVVAHDEMVANSQVRRQALKSHEIRQCNLKRWSQAGHRGRKNSRARKLMENPNLLRIVQTIVYEHDYFDRLMRQPPGK